MKVSIGLVDVDLDVGSGVVILQEAHSIDEDLSFIMKRLSSLQIRYRNSPSSFIFQPLGMIHSMSKIDIFT